MEYLMGIDLGTSSVKTMITDIEGKILGVSQEHYGIEISQNDYAEQKPDTWWNAAVSTIKSVLSLTGINAGNIYGVGLSGQMHGLVAVDNKGECIRPAIIWCDQRSKRQVDEVYDRIGKERFAEITLNPMATGFQLGSFLWLKENENENYRRIFKVMLPKDYIRLKLTGKTATDITDASGTMAFDNVHACWSGEIIEVLGLDIEKYPDVHSSYEIAGEISHEAALSTGLKKGTPVVYGGADQPMQAIGNGIVEKGAVSATIGTGGQIFTCLEKPLFDRCLRTHTFCNAVPGTWYFLGATLCAGLSLSWFIKNILMDNDYAELDKEAEAVAAGSEGLIFLPYLTGERSPHMDPFAKGIFFGMTLKHTRAHMIRAILEGVAYSMKDSIEILKKIGGASEKVIASGGGAKSSLWKQIQADIFESDIYSASNSEQACLGAAITASVGTGIFNSFTSACSKMVKYIPGLISPEPANTDIYAENYKLFHKVYQCNKQLFTGFNK